MPPTTHSCAPTSTAPTTVIAKPMSVRPFGVRPSAAHRERDRLEDLLDPAAGFVRDGHRRSARHAQDGALARGELVRTPPRGGGRPSRGPGAGSRRRRRARRRPRCHDTSGCDRPTWAMSSATVASPCGQAADDAQPVHVGHDLVEGTQLAQVVGLGDGRGDRAADAGGRGGQGWDSGWGLVRSWSHQPRFISIAVDATRTRLPLSTQSERLHDGTGILGKDGGRLVPPAGP